MGGRQRINELVNIASITSVSASGLDTPCAIRTLLHNAVVMVTHHHYHRQQQQQQVGGSVSSVAL